MQFSGDLHVEMVCTLPLINVNFIFYRSEVKVASVLMAQGSSRQFQRADCVVSV